MGRRQFAKDPKNVRHFKLVSRSQNDRFADDPDAPPLVLEPFAPPGAAKRSGLSEAELLTVPQSLEDAVGAEVFGQIAEEGDDDYHGLAESSRRGGEDFDPEDLEGDCYFPRDGYNYEQHCKNMSGGKKGGVVGVVLEATIKVPKEELAITLPTNEDEKELHRALDNAEEYEEIDDVPLEDLFGGGVAEPEDVMLWGPTALEDQDLPDLALFKAMRERMKEGAEGLEEIEEEEEEGARGGRRKGEAVNDADFEQFLADEYGEEEIGACDEEEIEGTVSLEKCEAVLDEYIHNKQAEAEKLHSISEPLKGTKDVVPRAIEETRALIEKFYDNEVEEEEEDASSGEDSDEDESKLWDCETVLSTLSNLSNRPGKIGRIKIVKKPAAALKPLKEDADGEEDEKEVDDGDDAEGIVELPDVITTRPRGETPEERRARKASVKEMRRVCRRMKKDSKEMYKAEALRLPAQTGADVRGKARCFKL